MKRRNFSVVVADLLTGAEIGKATKHAMTSAILESEAIVRELARSEGQLYEGKKARTAPGFWARAWIGEKSGRLLLATVGEIHEKAGASS